MDLPSLALQRQGVFPPTRPDALYGYCHFMTELGHPTPCEHARASGQPRILPPSVDPRNGRVAQPCVLLRPCSEEWEFYKPTIKSLYMDKNLNLREVIEIMKTKYSFNAT
jgi:hypothetical protein